MREKGINMRERWSGNQAGTDQEMALVSHGLCLNYPNSVSLSCSICKRVEGHCWDEMGKQNGNKKKN